ncbi:aminopeptidase N [Pseudooceanicola onchidii]|uniref:aminopeptidase N n=1 Tax=Pseudooceanicola onchidii TaxID=2562279 RepID=UPI0010A9F58F|nr:aminopeptidase N [Pseudooceanicola onchidii]
MTDAANPTIYLKDYTPPAWLVEDVHLAFRLAPTATRVTSKVRFTPNPDTTDRRFFLEGEQLTLIRAAIDGVEVSPTVSPEGLTCDVPDGPFTWEAEVEISPETNTALEGLYMSNGMYSTQCEAQGFRKITYYPDRPDVMAVFTVRIESDLPVLLSNGNKQAEGPGFAEWHDPWPKPAYLFALVAGELLNLPGQFTTRSGRDVELNVWVRKGDEDKCDFAMEALKKSMTWDEEVYGREYDLDIFNIVAVDDFNMGAMENKGLNIFNSSAVLASPETATDANFERIEAIIAHEYFHNWTGNRITCRDWFQLCLKEGLTVFRDAQFTADMRSEPVKRISDVLDLRGRQFREDGGPLAHPVRPESFQEINNFYTATVYEKGAEVIGMLKRLVGDDAYARALDLYFDRHDGQACTIEDWLKVFEDTTGRDLSQFKLWYSQAGTPRVDMTEDWADGTYTVHLKQTLRPTPECADKKPQVIPFAIGLLDRSGAEVVPTTLLEFTEAEQSFTFEGLADRPVASPLRGFSAPVILEREVTHEDRAFLLAHDTDPFNRWEAGRQLAKSALLGMIDGGQSPDQGFLDGLRRLVTDDSLDPEFRALCMGLPSEDDLAQALSDAGRTPDPQAIWAGRQAMRLAMADTLSGDLQPLYDRHRVTGPYSPDAGPAGRRALTGALLSLITLRDGGAAAAAQYETADNMTEQLGALSSLLAAGLGSLQLGLFADQWAGERLVMDKWFMVQVAHARPELAAQVAQGLTERPDFTMTNPNRFRAVFGALAMNQAGFHHASGAGYRLMADWLMKLDPVNPQTTARMCSAFQTWRRYDADRQGMMREQLDRIAGLKGLSRDTGEMVGRILDA